MRSGVRRCVPLCAGALALRLVFKMERKEHYE
jgi:hypothetical protein